MQCAYSFPPWNAIGSVCDFFLGAFNIFESWQPNCTAAAGLHVPHDIRLLWTWAQYGEQLHNPILVFGASVTKHFLNYFFTLTGILYNIYKLQHTSIYTSNILQLVTASPTCFSRWLSDLPLLKLFVHVAPCSKPPKNVTFSRSKTKHIHRSHTSITSCLDVEALGFSMIIKFEPSQSGDEIMPRCWSHCFCQRFTSNQLNRSLQRAVHHDTPILKSLTILHCPELFRTLFRLLVFNYFILCGWKLMTCPWTVYWTHLDANKTWYKVWSLEPSNWTPQIFPWVPKSLVSVKENSRGKGCPIFFWVF